MDSHNNASVAQYGTPTPTPTSTPPNAPSPTPTPTPTATLTPTPTIHMPPTPQGHTGMLPFTGFEVAIPFAAGVALVALGTLLRGGYFPWQRKPKTTED